MYKRQDGHLGHFSQNLARECGDFILRDVYKRQVNSRPGADVLDLGFGTGMLTARLYAAGHPVAGVDFSQNMLDAARAKMPVSYTHLAQRSASTAARSALSSISE